MEKGVFTPKEFVLAGDLLATTRPSWEWKSASKDKLSKSELPKENQYLYSKVPRQKRVKDLINGGETREKDVGDGWVVSERALEKEADKEKKFDNQSLRIFQQIVSSDYQGGWDIEEEVSKTAEEYHEYEEEDIDGSKVKVFKKKIDTQKKKAEEENKNDFETIIAPRPCGETMSLDLHIIFTIILPDCG